MVKIPIILSEFLLSALKLSYFSKLDFTLEFVNCTKMLFLLTIRENCSPDYMDMRGIMEDVLIFPIWSIKWHRGEELRQKEE